MDDTHFSETGVSGRSPLTSLRVANSFIPLRTFSVSSVSSSQPRLRRNRCFLAMGSFVGTEPEGSSNELSISNHTELNL